MNDRDRPTLEDELEQLTDELGEPIVQAALDGQYDWIREHYGDEAAECANYGWATDGTEEPLVLDIATKVYGHGILSTLARRTGSGFEVTHAFIPFGSEAHIASKRAALAEMRQRFEAGHFDADPPGAPPGAKERVRRLLEERERELEESPAA